MAFARLDGHLPALIVDLGDRQIEFCAAEWAESNSAKIEAFRAWYDRQFPDALPPAVTVPLPDAVPPEDTVQSADTVPPADAPTDTPTVEGN